MAARTKQSPVDEGLQSDLDIALSAAKAITDRFVGGERVTLNLPNPAAAGRLAWQIESLGVAVEAQDHPTPPAP